MSIRTLHASALLGLMAMVTSVALAQGDRQTVLGPGLYVFQTRTTNASCQDEERTGYVSTFLAPIHGVPGSREMRMTLTNSEYWPEWTITVDAAGRVIGDATLAGASGPTAPRNHFSTTRQGERFVGTGQRTYRANGQLCRVEYDALLRRIDQL